MTSKRYKNLFGMLAICLIAIVTGVAVGKIFVAMNYTVRATGTYRDYQDDESQVFALYKRWENGAGVNKFNAIELFEIAEYQLYHTDSYYSVMTGLVSPSMGSKQYQSTEALWRDGKFVLNKLSPGGIAPVVKIDTNVHKQVIYDTETGMVSVNNDGTFVTQNYEDKEEGVSVPIKGSFVSGSEEVYTLQEYETRFLKMPTMTILYIVSNKTFAGASAYVGSVKSENGTYSFELSLKGNDIVPAAIYYSKEVEDSGGSYPTWKELKISVTLDSHLRFKEIKYHEQYKMMGGIATVTDDFMQRFEYNNIPSIEEVL